MNVMDTHIYMVDMQYAVQYTLKSKLTNNGLIKSSNTFRSCYSSQVDSCSGIGQNIN